MMAARQPKATERDDEALLAAIAQGGLSALGELFDRHHARVRRVLRRAGAQPADVDDLVQATFLQIARSARTYEPRGSAGAWICGVALRLHSRRRRSVGRFFRMLGTLATAKVEPQQVASAHAVVEAREELARFARALATLSEKKRLAFVLVEMEEMSAEDAGIALGIPASTVRTRLYYARAELREILLMGDADVER